MSNASGEVPFGAGDTFSAVQVSPCVGGILRTWTDDGDTRLWSTPDAEWLAANQARGHISRTLRQEHRFREAAMLSPDTGTLLVTSRPMVGADRETIDLSAQHLRLEPAMDPAAAMTDAVGDLRGLLDTAIAHCVTSGEYFLVELGGWDAPEVPYCLFARLDETDGPVNVIETTPQPHESDIWAAGIRDADGPAQLRAPAKQDTTAVVSVLMLDAIRRWSVTPWDLAFTFGRR